MSEEREQRQVSRRTIAKGAAWAVPAVPLVIATPAYATSGPPPTLVIGGACKLPGASCDNVFVKGYVVEATITNSTPLTIYFYNEPGYLLTITEDNPDIDLFFQAAIIQSGTNAGQEVQFPFALLPGQSADLVFNAGENGASANESFNLTITMPWGHTPDPADDLEIADHEPVSETEFFEDTVPVKNPSCTVEVPCDDVPE